MLDAQLVVLAKRPQPGRTKTRLCPPLTLEQAAWVAEAALLDTLDVVLRTPVRRRLVVLDGAPEGLIPPNMSVRAQRGNGLAERLAAAVDDAFADCPLPLLLIGMDTPQVTPALLTDCVRLLRNSPSVLGHAQDGGWWAIGLHAADPRVFHDVPMSTTRTGAVQQERLVERGLAPKLLPPLRDIDTAEDLYAVTAQLAPGSRLAGLDVARSGRPLARPA